MPSPFWWVGGCRRSHHYGIGLWWLATARRKPRRAIVWGISFAALAAYTVYDGVIVKAQVDKRANAFRDLVVYSEPPAEVKAIMVSRLPGFPLLTGNGQDCSVICVKVLIGGRFKTYVIAVKDGMMFAYNDKQREEAIRNYRGPQLYRAYTVVEQPGCKTVKDTDQREVLIAWEIFGRCVEMKSAKKLTGRYFEVTNNNEIPGAPPWPVVATHIRLVEYNKSRDIAHVESGRPKLAFWFPVPGIFPHKTTSGLPDDWWPDVLGFEHSYGQQSEPVTIIEKVFGLALKKNMPMPNFDKQTPEGRLKLTRCLLFRGPMMERLRFVKNELARQRPFDQSYRDLILEFISRTKFSGYGYSQMIPYIAWLAAGDPGLAPVIAKMYVERAADSLNGASYVRALSYFGPDVLAPYAAQLLALYDRKFPKKQDTEHFHASLNLGIGGAGPAVFDKLIAELDVPSPDQKYAASAAASLCRAGDPRAVESLLKKLKALGRNNNPMSYAYALARLGHGKEALDAIVHVRTPQSPEFACLAEIVNKYPSGGAPNSICLMSGPNEQPKDAAWQYSDSALRCLAPRTPTPNG